MLFDATQQELKKAGVLLYAMDQGQTAVLTQPGPWGNAYSGYCAGLAVHWIALRYSGRDYAYDKKTLTCDTPDWRSTVNQNIQESAAGNLLQKLPVVLAQYGLFLNLGNVTEIKNHSLTGRDLRKIGEAQDGCYYISLTGHAVAMQRAKGHDWRFFDANYGEIKVGGGKEFERVMDWFMKSSGYDEQYKQLIRVIMVNPPPYINANALKATTAGVGATE